MITLEDILEEIVGEFDNDPQVSPAEIRPQDDGSVIVEGTAQVRNLGKALNWTLPSEGPKTMNGIVLEHFESFPPEGAVFTYNGRAMTVLAIDGNRVGQVRIEPATGDDEKEDSPLAADAG